MVLCAVHAPGGPGQGTRHCSGASGAPQGTRTGEEGAQGRESGPKAAGASLGPERGRRSGTARAEILEAASGGWLHVPHPPAMPGAPP